MNSYLSDKWKGNVENQLSVLTEIAQAKGFHPTAEPEKWYSVTKQDFLAHKVWCLPIIMIFRPKSHYNCREDTVCFGCIKKVIETQF